MSAFRQMQTVMNDQAALVKALESRFPEVEQHETPIAMQGWGAGNKANHANVIVRRKFLGTGYNDLGFRKGTDGNFKAIAEDDSRLLTPGWFDELARDYQEHKATALMNENGAEFADREVMTDGSVRLRYYVNA